MCLKLFRKLVKQHLTKFEKSCLSRMWAYNFVTVSFDTFLVYWSFNFLINFICVRCYNLQKTCCTNIKYSLFWCKYFFNNLNGNICFCLILLLQTENLYHLNKMIDYTIYTYLLVIFKFTMLLLCHLLLYYKIFIYLFTWIITYK